LARRMDDVPLQEAGQVLCRCESAPAKG